jgi:hypothetical protein
VSASLPFVFPQGLAEGSLCRIPVTLLHFFQHLTRRRSNPQVETFPPVLHQNLPLQIGRLFGVAIQLGQFQQFFLPLHF